MLEIDLVFQIFLFLSKAVAQFRNLLIGQSVVHRHGHLSRHLAQHLGIVLRKSILQAAGHQRGV